MASENDFPAPATPKDVIIVGGSLTSLMHALTLHRLGCSVLVLEQSPTNTPPSHLSGIALGLDVLTLLARFDRAANIPLGTPSDSLQYLDPRGHPRPFLYLPRLMTSWDALYFRLRANFDGLRSEYMPDPPGAAPQAGESLESAASRARYEIGQKVVGLEEVVAGPSSATTGGEATGGRKRVCVTVQGCLGESHAGRREYQLTADLVLGADGPNSIVRKICLGEKDVERRYAGYIAWRAVVPENQVSEETRKLFRRNITYSLLNGQHVVVYYIPSSNGSVEPGTRLLNFVWYTNEHPSSLDAIFTDKSGIRHRMSVSPDDLDPAVWTRQQSKGRESLPPSCVEIMNRIASPFVHLITDYYSPRVSFLDGKVLLVGDASALLRPHNAYATNQAAEQARLTERLVRGEIGWKEWEDRVIQGTYFHWKQSVWYGEHYQRGWLGGLVSAVQYWILRGEKTIRSWMGLVSS